MRLEGRATELTQLEDIFSDMRNGRGRLVVLAGPSGVGKTAVARAFLQRAVELDRMTVGLSTWCVEGQTRYRPLGPFKELLALLGGVFQGDALSELVGEKVPAWIPGAHAAPGRNALFEQYIGLWRTISERRPVVLFIDDIHWCDRSSLDLLQRFGAALGSLPLIILATYEADAGTEAISLTEIQRRLAANAIELGIRPLEADAIHGVIDQVLGGSASKDLGELLAPLTGGIPFYAEQLLRLLSETGRIRKRLFRYTVSPQDLPQAGTGVEALIRARMESLEPNLRWTLEAAALSGSIVDSAVVAGQISLDAQKVRELLRQAQEGHALLESVGEYQWLGGTRSSRFQFKHPLIRRAFAARVTGKRRGSLMARAAETIESLAAASVGELADEIAGLYLGAGRDGSALLWSQRAADLSERFWAPYETEDFLRAAIRLADDPIVELRFQNRLAGLYAATDREPEAEKLLEAVLERAQELEDSRTLVSSGTMLGWIRLERGAEPAALSQLTGALVDRARQSEQADQLVSVLDLSCVVAERVGRAEEALLMAEEALHVGDTSGEPELRAQAAYRLARVQISWGDPQEGRELAERALAAYGDIHAPDGVIACHDLLGLASFRAGDWDDALHHWGSALERLEEAGTPEQKIVMQTNIAELKTFRGEFEEAKERYDTALAMARELEDPSLILRCRAGSARLQFERGNYGKVLELTEVIRADIPESGAWREDFHSTAIRALAYLELGDELQAWQEAARLEQLYQGKEGWFERRAEGDAVRIRVIDLDSDSWLAGMVAEQGIGETTDKDRYGEAFLQYHTATVKARTKPGDARKAAQRAEEIFSNLGATPMLNRTRQLLAGLPAQAVEPEWDDRGDDEITEESLDSWFDSFEG